MSSQENPKVAGGIARAKSLSPERRREIARKGGTAKAQMKNLPRATHDSADHPLRIGNVEIPCYVLEDGTRVLSQRGVLDGLGMGRGTAGGSGDRLASFALGKGISPYVNSDLLAAIERPIKFRPHHGGSTAFGYPATMLADICDAVLAARKAGALQKQQEHIAIQAEILVRGFARVGIIALVDEATGYQKDRAADALSKILEAFIEKELQPWVKTFPAEFYEQLFRLRGLDYPTTTVQRPQYFGVLTNDIIYRRLAPGVLDELKKVTERDGHGRPKHKFFQKLTANIGYPKLREHLGSVVTLMKLSPDYASFKTKLDEIHPAYGKTLPLPLDAPDDTGRGL